MKYYVTSQTYDASSPPAIETIYRAVLTDSIARHKRMCAFDVASLLPLDTTSPSEPESVASDSTNNNAAAYAEFLNLLEVQPTRSVPSPVAHAQAVDALLRRTQRRSRLAIYKTLYTGRFCPRDGLDLSDSAEPVNCPKCGRPAELISEDRYFFRLPSYLGPLRALYKYRPEVVQPLPRGREVERFLAKGLHDVPISVPARFGGVPWPDDATQAVSRLFSELAMSLSGIGFGADGYGGDDFKLNWPPNLRVVSHAALIQHAVYWPAFLTAADMPLARRIYIHSALHSDSDAAQLDFLRQAAAGRFGSDWMRFLLLRDVQYLEDTRLDLRAAAGRESQSVPAKLEQFARHLLELVNEYCGGKIPQPPTLIIGDPPLEVFAADLQAEVRIILDAYNFSDALPKIWSLFTLIEQRVAEALAAPRSSDNWERHLIDVLHDATEGFAWVALLLHPVLPAVTDAIWSSLGQTTRLGDQLIDSTPWSALRPGKPVGEFPA